jgi:ribose transport system permease protein
MNDSQSGARFRAAVGKYAILLVLVGIVALFSAVSPQFFTWQNLSNILVQQSYVVIAAVGLAFVMIGGGMDLSIGYQMSLVGVTTAALVKWYGLPLWPSVGLGLALGSGLGFLNGWAANKLRVHTLIITLGTLTVFQGASYIVSRQSVILNLPPSFKYLGQGWILDTVPFSVVLMIAAVLAAGFVLDRTWFGRHVYAIGGNEEAARLSGVDVQGVRLAVFAICGFFVSIASMVLFARSGSASSSTGPGTEFSCMTAAVLGGISFKGGEGKMWGLVTGVFILGILGNGMQLVGMGTYAQYIVKGLVLLAAVGFDTWQKEGAVSRRQRVGAARAA